MVFDQLLLASGILATLLSSSFPSLNCLSVLILNLYICQLKRSRKSSKPSDETEVRAKLTSVKQQQSEITEVVKEVFDLAADFFCVYQDETVQCASKSFSASLIDIRTFWKDHLKEEYREDFDTSVHKALSGERVSLRIQLKRPAAPTSPTSHTILSLSPILDALIDSRKDDTLQLSLRRVAWESRPAVLIHMTLPSPQAPVHNFIKTFNHEFRTPLNIIIGLSDLVLGDAEITVQNLMQRQRLLRQCACTLLATINSIIHQCELEWKIPTGLQHLAFNPKGEIREAVQSIRSKLKRRGNSFDFILDNSIPPVLWGNVGQFRHVIAFLIQACSEVTENDTVFMFIKSENSTEKCELKGELSASCPAVCSASEFNSVLQLFCAPFESESSTDSPLSASILQKADRQSMLRLSVAREMCRLFFGDLYVNDVGTLSLHFSMSFSIREHFVLKRKGNIFTDEEEFVPVKSPSYLKGRVSDDILDDLTPIDLGLPQTKLRSQTHIVSPLTPFLDKRRRIKTVPGGQTSFEQPPSSQGDSDDTSPITMENSNVEAFALIAEDVPSNAVVLSGMLKRLGVKSMIVSNGKEALDFMEKFLPDIIFMDCQMPEMDGLEATRKIREMRITVPIIAVTANGPEKEKECLEAGMDFFISKPVRFERLASLLRRLNVK